MEKVKTIRSVLQSMRSALSSFLPSEILDLRKVWAYDPGRHYMRGPGPKSREKHAVVVIADRGDSPMWIDSSDTVVSSH